MKYKRLFFGVVFFTIFMGGLSFAETWTPKPPSHPGGDGIGSIGRLIRSGSSDDWVPEPPPIHEGKIGAVSPGVASTDGSNDDWVPEPPPIHEGRNGFPRGSAPIDGGVGLLLSAAAVLGASLLYRRKSRLAKT